MARSTPRIIYLDASAIVKLVVREAETDALRSFLGSAELISSEVVTVEVPRASFLKTGDPLTLRHSELVLKRFFLVALDDGLRSMAARAQPPDLRSLDAIHLVSALHVSSRVEAAIIYDHRLAKAARDARLVVETPGR
ncbi:MAG: type II toxin-antitoxin system VapC family toxin [Candidatus Dormibacteraceae bacterium]